jgi:WD40 repeat protein
MTEYVEYKMPLFAFARVVYLPHAQDNNKQPCLALSQYSGEIALWTHAALRKGEDCSHKFSHKLLGHQTMAISMAFSNSSSSGQEQQLLASGSQDKTVRLWDTHTTECVAVLEGHTDDVKSVAFSPDNRLLASASCDKTVRLWDVVERNAASPVHVLRSHTSWVRSVSFSPDGQQLASASDDCTVRLWSVPEGVLGPVLQHACPVWCVAFSPVVGSNVLASGDSYDGTINLWDVRVVIKRELHGHSYSIRSLAFSPDGSQLVSGSDDHTVCLWSVASGKLLKKLTGHSRIVLSVAFHPNGKQVASCSCDSIVRIWTVCEWSDRTHQLFGEEMKRLVFCLMCAKEKLNKRGTKTRGFPQLPMTLWLEIFAFLRV